MWAVHRVTVSSEPVTISLFTKTKKLDLKFRRTNFTITTTMRLSPIRTTIRNCGFPRAIILPRSVARAAKTRIQQRTNLNHRSVSLIVNNPPYRKFSLVKRQLLRSPHGTLMQRFLQLVQRLSPQFFLFRGIGKLAMNPRHRILRRLIRTFSRLNCDIHRP